MTSTEIERFVKRLAKSGFLDTDKLRRAGEIVRRESDPKRGARQAGH